MRSFLLALVLSVSACAGHDDGDDEIDCLATTVDDEFVIGLTKTGVNGKFDFRMTSFSPAPPARLLNEWTISITSTASGAAPLAASEPLAMTPYMPQHGHGAGIDVEITPMPSAGEFRFSPINLHMPGLWDVTVEVQTEGSPDYDRVVFKPCIPN